MSRSTPTTRPGFTFIEVMFAVLVLGVGVIMIATLLPVAIRTAQETREGAAGSSAIETGFHLIEQSYADFGSLSLAQTIVRPAGFSNDIIRPWTYPTRIDDWEDALGRQDPDAVAFGAGALSPLITTFGNRVSSTDPTFMWIPFYSRSARATDPPQLALVGVRARNIEQFPTSSVATVPAAAFHDGFFSVGAPNFQIDNHPIPIIVRTYGGSVRDAAGNIDVAEVDRIELIEYSSVTDALEIDQTAVSGAAVVLVDALGRLKVYRLGQYVGQGQFGFVWELAPDGGLDPRHVNNNATPADPTDDYNRDEHSSDNPGSVDQSTVGYLVGRMLENPADPWDDSSNPHVGPSPVVRVLHGKQLR